MQISDFGFRISDLPPTRGAICEAIARPPEVPGIPIRRGAQQASHETSANRRAWHPLGEGVESIAPRSQQGGDEFKFQESELKTNPEDSTR